MREPITKLRHARGSNPLKYYIRAVLIGIQPSRVVADGGVIGDEELYSVFER